MWKRDCTKEKCCVDYLFVIIDIIYGLIIIIILFYFIKEDWGGFSILVKVGIGFCKFGEENFR